MGKIYHIHYRGRGSTFYKTEAGFLEGFGLNPNASVTIYEEVETVNALEYKKNKILSNERNDQLSLVLDDDTYIAHISDFKEKIIASTKIDKYTKDNILRKISLYGMNKKTFDKIWNSNKNILIYRMDGTQEWFEILLKCRNFTKIQNTYWSAGTKINTPIEILENFKKAKISIKIKK